MRSLGRALEGTLRVVVLVIGYLFALIPIYGVVFAVFIGLVLLVTPRNRKHGVIMIVLSIGITALVVLSARSSR
jgi:hypothetical protein